MMDILVLGAGLSSSWLLRLLNREAANGLRVTVADQSREQIEKRLENDHRLTVKELKVEDETERFNLIENHKVIISLLPPFLHPVIARDCLRAGRHLVTASYVSEEMKTLDQEAKAKNVVLLNELGLDPGIDHLSALHLLDELRSQGADIFHFESHCGGLIAPEFDTNPWNYKFTWNPRNVVLAGQASAKFKWKNRERILPADRIFQDTFPLQVPGLGEYEIYANRDSLGYRHAYGLENADSILRGTIRKKGYSEAWRALQEWGLTDDQTGIPEHTRSLRELSNLFLETPDRIPEHIHRNHPGILEKLEWLELFSDTPLPAAATTPARALQWWLEQKWQLKPGDKDMVVMVHRVGYLLNGQAWMTGSSLIVKGEDQQYTAMAKTVGLPLGLAALELVKDSWQLSGVQIPTHPEIYHTLLPQLEQFDIIFKHEEPAPFDQ